MADQVVILRIVADLNTLGSTQLGVQLNPDADLGFRMWGGKDASGTLSQWLAKDRPGRLTSLGLTTFAGGGIGFVTYDNNGNLVNSATVPAGLVADHDDLNNISGGLVGEYNHLTNDEYTNLDIWVKEGTDRVLYSGGTELERVQVNGNRSINGATIFGTLDGSYNYVFKNGSCVMNRKGSEDVTWDCVNCYGKGGDLFNIMDNSRGASVINSGDGHIVKYTLPIGTSDNADIYLYERERTDVKGNKSYNDANIPLDLLADYEYEFRGINSIANHRTYNNSFVCTGCYLDDEVNPGAVVSFTALTTDGISAEYSSAGSKNWFYKEVTVIGTSYDLNELTDYKIAPLP